MIDVSVSYNKFKFLGNEFLTWLWYIMETDQELLRKSDPELVSLDIGNRIVFENTVHDVVESITIKGDDAGLEEGVLSLGKGAVVTELHLVYKSGDNEWKFNVKGESLNISGLKPPETARVEKKEDIEGAVLEKVFLYEKIVTLIDNLYKQFIILRVSNKWKDKTIPSIKKWIKN